MIKKIVELHELTAEEGMTLTNGNLFSKKVYLGCNDRAENWCEITDEEAVKRLAEQQKEDA